MELTACPPGHSRIVSTPHPITCEGQRNFAAELVPGEALGPFLRRSVPDWTGDAWEVRINGVVVPHEVMERVRPKSGTLIEVRGVVRKQALYIVAMAALTYFTFGLGAAAAGGWAGVAATVGGVGGALLASAIFIGGSILINKVLGPKPANSSQRDQNPVHSLGAGRNQIRQYQPLPLVFGRVKFAPDVISAPSTWYEGDDQYVGMVLTPGLNVHRVEELYLGDSLLSAFDGVQVYYSGFPGMPEQDIPLFSDADTIQGGELSKDRTYVQRTTPARTVRIQINLEYILGDQTAKGKDLANSETVVAQYRPVGSSSWLPLVTRTFRNNNYDTKRATLSRDVAEGQYDVRVQRLGQAIEFERGKAQFQWTTMTAVQADTADYAGIPRIGILMKASGQLQAAPDEIRCVAVSAPVPVWNGTEWVTQETSNPAAHILHYSRGITGGTPTRIAGIGLDEDMIDIASLQAFGLHCEAEGLTYDFVVRDPRSHDEMVNTIAAAGFGQTTWAKGRLAAIWAADEQPEDGVVNMATIKRGEFQVDYALENAADGVEVTYYDVDVMETRTLRIPAPGVTTMLNPAQVTLEGVGHESQAAMLGRWHLAQSLYQYKDISFATDIEHLSYGRMSNLRLSHDLTQWGFSGQVAGASIDGGVVTLRLDEPVRAPTTGKAYIGLRIPGERNYRVFEVAPFTGETQELRLVGAWPNDAQLPGVGFYRSNGEWEENPAWDTIWCYDFKVTPGYRVRVVAIEPESDLKGARVAVVPESPEFWQYVKTGTYIPAPNESLLPTRPVASNLAVAERQVVQGDTVFTELVATFDISGGLVGDVIVQMTNENGELEEVARTTTRTASWRIPRAGTYQVVVRPFSPDGSPGIAAATIYSTIGADAPPVLVDLFDVVDRGGLRLYTWGWLADTTQSADFAGVEIRYIEGSHASPDWEAMTPVGEGDGYYAAPFEIGTPAAGTWTFALRSRNTAGALSTGMRVLTKTLGGSLEEIIGALDPEANLEKLRELQEAIDQETVDRVAGDLEAMGAIASEAATRANDLATEALERAQAVAAERAARQAALAAAQGRINDILSDSIISPVEKPQLIIDYQALINELPGIVVEAQASEVDSTPYQAAIGALIAYMATLTTPVRWDDTSDITYIT